MTRLRSSLGMTAAALALAVAMPAQRAAPVCAAGDDPNASAVLNCMTLVPVPDVPTAAGIVHLRPVPTPFGVAVHADGRPRYRLIATFDGLPAPASLGDYSVYVAWVYTVSLDSVLKLGPVRNGVVDLGELSYLISYSHFSKQHTSPTGDPSFEPGSMLEAYGLLNMSLDWRNIRQTGLDASLFVTNATNKLYRVANANSFNGLGIFSSLYGEPRMYGVKLRYSFGER